MFLTPTNRPRLASSPRYVLPKFPLRLSPILQVAGLARRVRDATVLAARFAELVISNKELSKKTNKRALDRRVPTRWNSDLTCLDAHLLLREPVKTLTSDPAYDLAKYKLTVVQWGLSEKLQDVLKVRGRERQRQTC